MAIRTGSGNVNSLFIASALAAAEGSTLNVTRDGEGTGVALGTGEVVVEDLKFK
jgi:hypothetical protein